MPQRLLFSSSCHVRLSYICSQSSRWNRIITRQIKIKSLGPKLVFLQYSGPARPLKSYSFTSFFCLVFLIFVLRCFTQTSHYLIMTDIRLDERKQSVHLVRQPPIVRDARQFPAQVGDLLNAEMIQVIEGRALLWQMLFPSEDKEKNASARKENRTWYWPWNTKNSFKTWHFMLWKITFVCDERHYQVVSLVIITKWSDERHYQVV